MSPLSDGHLYYHQLLPASTSSTTFLTSTYPRFLHEAVRLAMHLVNTPCDMETLLHMLMSLQPAWNRRSTGEPGVLPSRSDMEPGSPPT